MHSKLNSRILTVSIVIGTTIVVGSCYKLIKNFIPERKPKVWKEVGELDQIFCFPIKSCAPIELETSFCGQLGHENGHIRDRVFVVVRANGEYVTARVYPKMVLIRSKIVGDSMTLTAPGMEDIELDIQKLYESESEKFMTWFKDVVDVKDCSDRIAEWLSTYLIGESSGLRMKFYYSKEPKAVSQPRNRPFKAADRFDQGALQDETSFMLMNQSSIDDLNVRLKNKLHAVPLRFRPNFLIKGVEAYAEDKWKWIKIGEDTIFEVVQPCTRCIFTNIDPENGERHPDMEPLKTLKTYRVFPQTGATPWLGVQLGVRQKGKVRKGDRIYVSE